MHWANFCSTNGNSRRDGDMGMGRYLDRVVFHANALSVAHLDCGGFGQKAHFFAEEFIVPWIAKEIRRPVKWIEDRREHLLCAAHAKQCTIYMDMSFKRDGTITGMKVKNIGDSGAYSQYPWSGLIESVAANNGAPGAFTFPNISFETVVCLTNKMATGAYRGVGWSAGCYAREMVLTKAAQLLRLDIVDIYRKNFIRAQDFPYTTATNQTYDSGDYHKVLDKCIEVSDYTEQKKRDRREIARRWHIVLRRANKLG
jgi:CO/xanthine dehydrogenase Mo-binding subunit